MVRIRAHSPPLYLIRKIEVRQNKCSVLKLAIGLIVDEQPHITKMHTRVACKYVRSFTCINNAG